MRNKIIAVDFDGTLVTNAFPDIGDPIPEVINYVKSEASKGARIILWTSRVDNYLDAAVAFCKGAGIPLAAVNENLPEEVEAFGDSRKIFADEYIDDRAIPFPIPESGMYSWAKQEIAYYKSLVSNGDADKDSQQYTFLCLDAALEAYETLLRQPHSGYSIQVTASYLQDLIKGRPLSPIVDTPDVWNLISNKDGVTTYQCRRMSSLFKYEKDGIVYYSDIDRFLCVSESTGATYYSGLVRDYMDKMYPIVMPYYPRSTIRVYCDDFLYDDTIDSDFDTVGIHYAILEDGSRLNIGSYYKECEAGFELISESEYMDRLNTYLSRKEVDSDESLD